MHTLIRLLKIKCLLLICILPFHISAQDLILEAMKSEADRSLAILKEQPAPAYYISYRVQDKESHAIVTRFGKLENSNRRRDASLHVIVRVGNHEVDSRREYMENFWDNPFDPFTNNEVAPIDNQPFVLKIKLWEATNLVYKNEVKKYEKIKAAIAVNVAKSDQSGDFSREISEQYYEAPVNFSDLKFDVQKWEEKIRKYSLAFNDNKDLMDGSANLNVELVRKNFIDTDGAVIAQNKIAYRLSLTAKTIADDGMELPVHQSYFALEEKDLPSDDVIIADAQRISKLASQLKNAPVAEPYSGPAIMSSKASGVFFHEIFGHRIEGTRLKQESDAQTFKNKLNEAVLPADISIVFDPQLKEHKGMSLCGGYVFDDEGVRGQRVTVVENGIMKSFLMSRTPVDGFPKSNGHGRGDKMNTEARQSNMIVESSRPKSEDELRIMLMDELKRTGKEFGYLFDQVSGGFTSTGRYTPNAFNVTPLVVYRIYADNRPDELVRGINLIGTPLSMFSQIAACGTESSETHERWAAPFVLVGSFQLNNLRIEQGTTVFSGKKVSLDNDQIGVSVWSDLDAGYKTAVQYYGRKMGLLPKQQQTPEERALPDYEKTPVVNLILPPEKINADREYWETYARTASAVANKYPEIIKSEVAVTLIHAMYYYYDTEGSQYAVPFVDCNIEFIARTMTDEGEEIREWGSIARSSTDRLPDLETFAAECEEKIIRLLKLKWNNVPVADKMYIGPVLLEKNQLTSLIGFSFFNNQMTVFKNVLRPTSSVQIRTNEAMMGENIISNQLTVKSLSGTKMYKGQILDGHFPIDTEGVIPAEELILIENGVLKNMLNNRIPSLKNQHSSGHSRIVLNFHPIFRTPHIFVSLGVIQFTGQNTYPDTELRQKLIKAARDAGLEYAYIVNDEGFTRIYVTDGREESVRDLHMSSANFNYKSFRKILGVSDEEYFSIGQWGSPTSTFIIPKSMLFEELELSKSAPQNRPAPPLISKPTE